MTISTLDGPVRLRPGMGVLLAVQWNAPLLLLFGQPWLVFVVVMAANCYLWAIGCFLAGRTRWFRNLLFRSAPDGPIPRWQAATVWMAILGTACLIAGYFTGER